MILKIPENTQGESKLKVTAGGSCHYQCLTKTIYMCHVTEFYTIFMRESHMLYSGECMCRPDSG